MSTSEVPSTDAAQQPAAYTTTTTHTELIGGVSKLNLKHLVNLALSSSPKAGVVNFNLLKVFLLELLKALDLGSHEFKLDSSSMEPNLASLVDNEMITDFDSANQVQHNKIIIKILLTL